MKQCEAKIGCKEFAQSGAAAVASTRAATLDFSVAMAAPITRILTLHSNNLSDFVLSLPALHALRESFPSAKICGVMRPALAGLLDASPLLDEVWTRAPGGLSQQTALMLQLHAAHFDLAFALSPSRTTTLLALSSGAATRIGFSVAKMDALLTHRIEAAPPFSVENYLELARAAGCAAHRHDARGLISVSPVAQKSAARILEKHGIGGDFLIAAPAGASSPLGTSRGESASAALGHFAPALRAGRRGALQMARRLQIEAEKTVREYSQRDRASASPPDAARDDFSAAREYSHDAQNDNRAPQTPTENESSPADSRRAAERDWDAATPRFIAPSRALKEWPAPHWARALDELAPRLPILLLGNAPSPVVPWMRNPVLDLSGRLDLPTMAALCGAARLFIGTDSGLMHLAAAQETPVVALFGPTDWRRNAPRGASTRVLHCELKCAPCQRRDCLWHGENERACLTQIAPETVVRAALELVGL